MKAESILVALYPQSACKFVVTTGKETDFQAIDNVMCFVDDFEEQFRSLYEQYGTIDTIYVTGVKSFYEPFVKVMESIVSDDVDFIQIG